MKKISLFLCTVLLSTTTIFAQNSSIGLKGGVNISNLSNSGTDMGSKVGFNGGLLAHVHLAPNLALQPEVVYSAQGAKYTVAGTEHSLNLNYINIPLQLQYMFANGFRLQTGPQVGFLANVKDKISGTNNETNFFNSEDFKTVDFSWSAGLSYLGASGLGIDGRYNFGISNINNFGNNAIKNNVFQAGLFYMLNNNDRPATRHSRY
jgi:hypothetical protein